jgi:predicted GNAT family N-acyltransferase
MAEPALPAPGVVVREIDDPREMETVVAIRHQVFVVEQGVTTNVRDNPHDRDSRHVVGIIGQQIVGSGRLHLIRDEGQIAWVAVLPAYRHRHVGRAIMRRLIEIADEAGTRVLFLNAQTHALRFYQHLGFEAIGEVFSMSGIEHQLMARGRGGQGRAR